MIKQTSINTPEHFVFYLAVSDPDLFPPIVIYWNWLQTFHNCSDEPTLTHPHFPNLKMFALYILNHIIIFLNLTKSDLYLKQVKNKGQKMLLHIFSEAMDKVRMTFFDLKELGCQFSKHLPVFFCLCIHLALYRLTTKRDLHCVLQLASLFSNFPAAFLVHMLYDICWHLNGPLMHSLFLHMPVWNASRRVHVSVNHSCSCLSQGPGTLFFRSTYKPQGTWKRPFHP